MKKLVLLIAFIFASIYTFGQTFGSPIDRTQPYFQGAVKVKKFVWAEDSIQTPKYGFLNGSNFTQDGNGVLFSGVMEFADGDANLFFNDDYFGAHINNDNGYIDLYQSGNNNIFEVWTENESSASDATFEVRDGRISMTTTADDYTVGDWSMLNGNAAYMSFAGYVSPHDGEDA